MGWFKKRSTDPEEIERLKAEIVSMGARLNASEAAKSELDHTVRGIADRLDAPTPAPPAPPLPTSPPPAPPPTGGVVASLEFEELSDRVERLAASVDTSPPAVDGAGIEQLTNRVDHLTARLDETPAEGSDRVEIAQITADVERIARRLDEVDGRITSISTELANQITELSGELDANGPAPGGAIVDELRDAQTRLAGEQARYQIAFRQDLADLADRLKRS